MHRDVSRRGLILLAWPFALLVAGAAGLTFISPKSSDLAASPVSPRLLLARGDLQGAERILRQLPGAEARFLLGKLLAERGQWREAQSLLVGSLTSPEHKAEALR